MPRCESKLAQSEGSPLSFGMSGLWLHPPMPEDQKWSLLAFDTANVGFYLGFGGTNQRSHDPCVMPVSCCFTLQCEVLSWIAFLSAILEWWP